MEYLEKGFLLQNVKDISLQLQPCGVDLTIAKVFETEGIGSIDFDNSKRVLPDYKEVNMHEDHWLLDPGLYNITINEYVRLPNNIAALVLPRSSLMVCGATISSALWDPGYEGRGVLELEVKKKIRIYKDARIGQMIFFKLEKETEPYNGIFRGEDVLKNGKRGKC